MKKYSAMLATALIVGYVLLCVLTIPYFAEQTLHFRGQAYTIAQQDGRTVYTHKGNTIELLSGEKTSLVTFHLEGAASRQYSIRCGNGGYVEVYQTGSGPVLTGFWKDGALYDASGQINGDYAATAKLTGEAAKAGYAPFPAEALDIAMKSTIAPRGWHWFILVPLGLCVVAVSYKRPLYACEREFLHRHGMGSDVRGYVERYLKK